MNYFHVNFFPVSLQKYNIFILWNYFKTTISYESLTDFQTNLYIVGAKKQRKKNVLLRIK